MNSDSCGQRFDSDNKTAPGGYPPGNGEADMFLSELSDDGTPNIFAPPPQPVKKSRKGLVIGICSAVFLIAAMTLVALFVFPGFLNQEKTPPESTTVQTVAPTTKAASPDSAKETEGAKSSAKTKNEETTQAATDSTVETTAESTEGKRIPSITQGADENKEPNEPAEEDFSEWLTDGKLPENAAALEESEIGGTWKAMFIYNDIGLKELGIVEITYDAGVVKVKIKPRSESNGDAPFVKSEASETELTGVIDDGKLIAKGNSGELKIDRFCKQNDRQYAIGEFVNEDGKKAIVGLVRE